MGKPQRRLGKEFEAEAVRLVETFFKTLKSDVWRTVFQTRAEATAAIGRYIDGFYNPVRRHSALNFISPLQFERQGAR
ncbi:mobile element protein [Bosea sp. BIWAKO-01]|nr:mobile element protein [Bosea sp. BIWAKO-01]